MILIRPSVPSDAEAVGLAMRAEDREECLAASGLPPVLALQQARIASAICLTVWEVWDGNVIRDPIAMFGVVDSGPGHGFVWFLGTDAIARQSKVILREAPKWLDFFEGFYRYPLFALADERNQLHLKWCGAVGFHRNPDKDIYIANNRFVYIER